MQLAFYMPRGVCMQVINLTAMLGICIISGKNIVNLINFVVLF
jgi:hypothetical protein